ncbi:MAG: GNAT family N-acetyltransferase, partial [Candidatus Hodarchaeales archaeon]
MIGQDNRQIEIVEYDTNTHERINDYVVILESLYKEELKINMKMNAEQLKKNINSTTSDFKNLFWLGYYDGEPAGRCQAKFPLKENINYVSADIFVKQELRRKGVGRDLLKAVVQASKQEKRTLMSGISGKSGKGWCERIGAELTIHSRGFRATIGDIDFTSLKSKIKEIKERGIEVDFYTDGFPEELLQEVCDLYNVIFPLLPKGQEKVEDWHWTVDRLKEYIANYKNIDSTNWALIARDGKTGKMCGISEAGWFNSSPGEIHIYYGG